MNSVSAKYSVAGNGNSVLNSDKQCSPDEGKRDPGDQSRIPLYFIRATFYSSQWLKQAARRVTAQYDYCKPVTPSE